jgi:hypothetical protein
MSDSDMIGERRPFMTIRPRRKAGLAAVALVAASATLGGCMGDPFRAAVDPNSPAAAKVSAVMRENPPYPHWSEFPAEPTGVPTPADIKQRTASLQETQQAVLSQASQIDWTLSGTEEWAGAARGEINPNLAVPPAPSSAADTEAFVRAARALATPPPPPK